MKSNITKSDSSDSSQPVAETAVYLSDDWFGEESAEAWRTVLGDLIKRGPQRPQFLIVDGAAGLEKAIDVVWDGDRWNDVPYTSTRTCWRTRPSACTRR